MSRIIDILLDEDQDAMIDDVAGDFTLGDATGQSMQMLIISQKGEWKQHPYVGVGIADYMKEEKGSGLKAEIKRQLKADGMTLRSVIVNKGQINVDASY
ncbi:MAG TPA: hypothetical protein ENN08_06705 [Bacteroidales bacterium]|nr:hypothetical protein [Bacteroidales bacterium]